MWRNAGDASLMYHTVTANFGVGDFNAATFACNYRGDVRVCTYRNSIPSPLMVRKYARRKVRLFFWFESSIVDRLRLRYFAVRPAQDALRRGNSDLYIVKPVNTCRHLTRKTSRTFGL